jgi:hypothetical protein
LKRRPTSSPSAAPDVEGSFELDIVDVNGDRYVFGIRRRADASAGDLAALDDTIACGDFREAIAGPTSAAIASRVAADHLPRG